MNKIKKGFFQRIKLAVFNIEKYQDLVTENLATAIKYFIKLILLFTIIISLGAVYKFAVISEFLIGAFEKDVPEFTFANNELVAEEVINTTSEYQDLKLRLIVDTTIENDEEKVKEYITEISKQENGAVIKGNRNSIESWNL